MPIMGSPTGRPHGGLPGPPKGGSRKGLDIRVGERVSPRGGGWVPLIDRALFANANLRQRPDHQRTHRDHDGLVDYLSR